MKSSAHIRDYLLALILGVFVVSGQWVEGDPLRFNQNIRPILADRCFKCHGPDRASRKAGLCLDQSESAYGPRKDPTEHAIVPGKPKESVLVRRIFATDPDDVMPPPASNLILSSEEKKTLRRWIAEGAKYEPHWAFIPPPASMAAPSVKQKN